MSEEFALTDEKLDELFVKEVISVTQIVEKLPSNELKDTCTFWFKIFQNAQPVERFARNFMLLLMHKQLNSHNNLGYPFTDARSCHRDLRTLHQITKALLRHDGELDDQGVDEESDESAEETCNTTQSNASSDVSCHTPRISGGDAMKKQLVLTNKELEQRNLAMSQELHLLQSEKAVLLQQRQSLEGKVQTLTDHNNFCSKEIGYLKHIFACSAVTALKSFSQLELVDKPNYFLTLFSVLCENDEDKRYLKSLDEQLGIILRTHIQYYVNITMHDQINRAFEEVRNKFKNFTKVDSDTHMKEMTLTAMRCLLTLQKVFLESYRGHKRRSKLILDFLEQRYNELCEP